MPQKPIDYAALARQMGGAPVTDAAQLAELAKQFGGVPAEGFNTPRLVFGEREVAAMPGVPERQMRAIAARQGRLTPERLAESREEGKMVLPAIGAGVATALTGGTAAIPLLLSAAGGGAAGQGIADAPEEMDAFDRLARMATAGAEQASFQGAGILASKAAPVIKQGARNWWNRAIKVPDSVAKKTQTMRSGGSLDQGKDEVAETLMSRNRGTARRGTVEKLRDSLDAFDTEVNTIITQSKGMVSRGDIAGSIWAHMADFTDDTAAGLIQKKALYDSLRMLNNKPPMMTVQQAQKAKREIYDFYRKSFPAGAAESATAMAEKVKGSALRNQIARAEPAVEGVNAEMSKLIPATSAMEKAVSRLANHNASSLTGTIALASNRPAAFAAALINNPLFASFTAQQIYRMANLLPASQLTAANMLRGLQMMTGASAVPSRAQGAGPRGQ
jgi:hypothetical protein